MSRIIKIVLLIGLGFLIGISSFGSRTKDRYYKYISRKPVAEGFYPNPFGLEKRWKVNSEGKLEVYLVDRDTGWGRKISLYGISPQPPEQIKKTPKVRQREELSELKGKETAQGFVEKPLDLILEVDMNDDGKLETFLVNPNTGERLPVKQVDGKTQLGSYDKLFPVIAESKKKISAWKASIKDFFSGF